MTEAEAGVMQPQAGDTKGVGPLEAGRGEEGLSPAGYRRRWHLDLDFWPPELRDDEFLWL